MVTIRLIPEIEFNRVLKSKLEYNAKLALIADMCRVNTLSAVQQAGSGHLGSSMSAMDIVVRLYYHEMNVRTFGIENPHRDIYFSSKGHDVPGLYSVLYSIGIIKKEMLLRLRRIKGLDGHPDVRIPGIEANSGSLGMGISKGKGMAWAKRRKRLKGNVFVLMGDGEFQEGQNFEGMQSAAHHSLDNLTVIVDHNKVQSDKPVDEIIHLGDLNSKFRSFGWYVTRCNGNNQEELESAFYELKNNQDKPKMLIADTIKGCGISFMEHPQALIDGEGYYPYHSGAPSDDKYMLAYEEIEKRINDNLRTNGLEKLKTGSIRSGGKKEKTYSLLGEPKSLNSSQLNLKSEERKEYVADAYGKCLVNLAEKYPNFVVLDADLSADCRTREFKNTFPDRFIECGIAEQDMVSTAGGFASQGLLPIVNSFASFLASRANEQIYNNATEGNKIIYVCHYAGLIPAGPGKSHQSIRDISLFGALPNCIIMQPCNTYETKRIVEFAVEKTEENCMIRLVIGPSPRKIVLPKSYNLVFGKGIDLTEGEDALVFAYGPVMIHEGLLAAEILSADGISVRIVNMPWLNRIDREWFSECVVNFRYIFVIDDHSPFGGLGDHILNEMVTTGYSNGRKFTKFAIEGFPECGTPDEVLKYHQLDGISVANRIKKILASET